MIDALVSFTIAPAGDVIVLDLWDGSQPQMPDMRSLQVEPQRWWLINASAQSDAIAAQIGERGALTPIGGLMRATLIGPGWRELLIISGCFDVENPRFGSGHVAATILHHVPVWIAPTGEATCEVYLPASYATTLIELWSRSATGQGGPP